MCLIDKGALDHLDCFDDRLSCYEFYDCLDSCDNHTSRVYVESKRNMSWGSSRPRHAVSWRRRYGLGGPYYPSRYYTSPPPCGQLVAAAQYSHYPRGLAYAAHPRPVLAGGIYPQCLPPQSRSYASYASYPRRARYHTGGRAIVPASAVMVSLHSFLFPFCPPRPSSSCLPVPITHRFSHRHWLASLVNTHPMALLTQTLCSDL